MNTVTVVGRAGQDAEIKYFDSGKIRTTFSLAVNRWDSKTKENVTDWFNIEIWGDEERKLASNAGDYIKRGREVAVDGRISVNKWNDASGEVKTRYLITANNFRLLGSRRDAE